MNQQTSIGIPAISITVMGDDRKRKKPATSQTWNSCPSGSFRRCQAKSASGSAGARERLQRPDA
jgi:hypothetical protein